MPGQPEKDPEVTVTSPSDQKSPIESSQPKSDSLSLTNDDYDEQAVEAIRVPWSYKWIALLCVIAFPIGQTWTNASLKPLKNTLRNELGINNTQFGVISSADAIVNTVWPIVGGMLLDWYGTNIVTIFCTSIIFIGSVISASGVHIGLWRMLVGGHIMMGFGIAVLDSAQQKFFYHWFGAGGLAFAFGLENAVAKSTSLVAGTVAIPIRNNTGWYGYTFWITVAFCGASFLINLAYVIFEKTCVPEKFRLTTGRSAAMAKDSRVDAKKKFSFESVLRLPWAYLMLPMTQLLQSGAADGFDTSAPDIIRMKGYDEAVAGYLHSGSHIIPILLSPLVGMAIDRYGHRFHYVAMAPILWIIACSLIGFTNVHPLVALVFSNLAGTINSMPLQICIPLLLRDQTKIGTAFGLWRAFNNSGSTIMDIAFGVLQDGTEGMQYDRVLKLAIGLKTWAFALGVTYIIVDYTLLGRGMTMTRKAREQREKVIEDPAQDPLTKRSVKPRLIFFALALLCSMVITAWVLFFINFA